MEGQISQRVLLVDDDSLIRKLVSRDLVRMGYVVRTAIDGLDALAKLRAGLPDLIISDLHMPRMSGVELLRVVRTRFPQIPVIVISSVAAGEMPEGLPADAYFHKSGLGFQQLLGIVSDLARNPPLRDCSSRIDDKPADGRWDGAGHYIIGCEDCLREFSVPRVFHMGRGAKVTICVHCGNVVRFLVAEDSQAS